jgi:hypothetical protein
VFTRNSSPKKKSATKMENRKVIKLKRYKGYPKFSGLAVWSEKCK